MVVGGGVFGTMHALFALGARGERGAPRTRPRAQWRHGAQLRSRLGERASGGTRTRPGAARPRPLGGRRLGRARRRLSRERLDHADQQRRGTGGGDARDGARRCRRRDSSNCSRARRPRRATPRCAATTSPGSTAGATRPSSRVRRSARCARTWRTVAATSTCPDTNWSASSTTPRSITAGCTTPATTSSSVWARR